MLDSTYLKLTPYCFLNKIKNHTISWSDWF